ncbi:hypothetical protein EJB05_50227, partial [Eragrostis curvula]
LPDGGSKTFCERGRLRPWFIDRESYSLLQLVDDIGAQRMWGSKQYITLWRELDDEGVEIKNDENLLEWIDLNIEKGEVCIYAQIEDFEGPLQCSPTKRRCHPTSLPTKKRLPPAQKRELSL